MTGMILAGAKPLDAVRLQVVVMFMLLAAVRSPPRSSRGWGPRPSPPRSSSCAAPRSRRRFDPPPGQPESARKRGGEAFASPPLSPSFSRLPYCGFSSRQVLGTTMTLEWKRLARLAMHLSLYFTSTVPRMSRVLSQTSMPCTMKLP